MAKSRVLETLENLQEGADVRFVAFGDSIYPTSDYIKSYINDFYDDDDLDDLVDLHNKAMKSISIAIEWNYATTANILKNYDCLVIKLLSEYILYAPYYEIVMYVVLNILILYRQVFIFG